MERLSRSFFLKPTLTVAKNLLGKYLVHKIGEKLLMGKIVETEAYIGPEDKASHAYKGKRTKRNRAEFMIGGHIYIYLVYGMYWQLNISTGPKGNPECVLIRALEPIKGIDQPTNGPGKLCKVLKLSGRHYGLDISRSKNVYLLDPGREIPKSQIVTSKRIGIDYAGAIWTNKPWRFYLKNNPFVSRK